MKKNTIVHNTVIHNAVIHNNAFLLLAGFFKISFIALSTTYRTLKAVTIGKFSNNSSEIFFKEMKLWASEIVKATGTEIQIQGLENINKNETYIYIANHTNLLDIPVLIKAIPDNIHFMYKESLQKVPMLGFALKNSPFIPIVRENIKNSMEGINKSVESLKNSGSVIIFPEGSRSKTGELAPFKRGAFMIASKAEKKIIPITIIGIEKILPADNQLRLTKGIVKVIINKPIEKLSENRTEMMNTIQNLHLFFAEQIKNEKKFAHIDKI